MALHRQLLPRRRLRLRPPRLPRHRDSPRGHEQGALRVAPQHQHRRNHRHARHRIQRQGNLRQVLGTAPRTREQDRDLQPVRGVRQQHLALQHDRRRRREHLQQVLQEAQVPPLRLRLRDRQRRHHRGGRLPAHAAPGHPRRGQRGRPVSDPLPVRLRRAPHRRHRRQAHPVDPQRPQHQRRQRHRRRAGHAAAAPLQRRRGQGLPQETRPFRSLHRLPQGRGHLRHVQPRQRHQDRQIL